MLYIVQLNHDCYTLCTEVAVDVVVHAEISIAMHVGRKKGAYVDRRNGTGEMYESSPLIRRDFRSELQVNKKRRN